MDARAAAVPVAVKNRAMDVAPVGIVLSDPHQSDNPIIYANETFRKLTGYDPEEIIGRNCRFLQGEDTAAAQVTRLREAIDAKESVKVELLNYRADGEPFWNEVTIAPVHDEDGNLLHFVGFQSDVTERKEAQLALAARTEELEHVIHRLNGLLQDITEELMHANSRDETERAICQRVIEADPYRLAWVGEFHPVSGLVTPTNWAGEHADLAEMPLDGAAADALARAIEEKRVSVVSEPDQLRNLGCTDAIQAAAIVPLQYRRQRYGVLVVGTHAVADLEEPERTVLGSLGQTIATAIHAAQTRRQVASNTRAVAEVCITDGRFPPIRLGTAVDAPLHLEGVVEHRDGSASLFLTTPAEIDALVAASEEIDAIESLVEINRFDDRVLVECRETSPSTVTWLAQLGVTIAALTVADGRAQLTLEMFPHIDGRGVIGEIEERYPGTDLLSYRTEDRPPQTRGEFIQTLTDRLTKRQQLALKRAYHGGFYADSRQVSGDQLADSMGISRPTFHQHRRAAERKILEAIFDQSGEA